MNRVGALLVSHNPLPASPYNHVVVGGTVEFADGSTVTVDRGTIAAVPVTDPTTEAITDLDDFDTHVVKFGWWRFDAPVPFIDSWAVRPGDTVTWGAAIHEVKSIRRTVNPRTLERNETITIKDRLGKTWAQDGPAALLARGDIVYGETEMIR
jgi:hypothetical protein